MGRAELIRGIVGKARLRFPAVFVLLLVLTGLDVLFPDLVPFVDEIVLALLTVLFGLGRERRGRGEPAAPADDAGGPGR